MLIAFVNDEIIGKMFEQYNQDHDININDEADLRCAIKAYSHYVLNTLVDRYGVGERESEL